jgi:hypothetical protein
MFIIELNKFKPALLQLITDIPPVTYSMIVPCTHSIPGAIAASTKQK